MIPPVVASGLIGVEQSFYGALEGDLCGDGVLVAMAGEQVEMLQRVATIEWQFRENVRANLRPKIQTLLKR